jgi:hypothetical protein
MAALMKVLAGESGGAEPVVTIATNAAISSGKTLWA